MGNRTKNRVQVYLELTPEGRTALDTLKHKLGVNSRNEAAEVAIFSALERQSLDPLQLKRVERKLDEIWEEL